MQGVLHNKEGALPLSLAIAEPMEPDTRSGAKPAMLHGTVTVTALASGSKYTLYRWDSVDAAFDFANPGQTHDFTAGSSTYTFIDPAGIVSSGATYYSCLPSAAGVGSGSTSSSSFKDPDLMNIVQLA
jgi:hypothetical protein